MVSLISGRLSSTTMPPPLEVVSSSTLQNHTDGYTSEGVCQQPQGPKLTNHVRLDTAERVPLVVASGNITHRRAAVATTTRAGGTVTLEGGNGQSNCQSSSSVSANRQQRRLSSSNRSNNESGGNVRRIGEYENATYWVKLVIFIGIAKMFLEASLRGAQFLEVAVIGSLSFVGRIVPYSVEIVTYCLTPLCFRWFELHSQAKFLLFIGAISVPIYIYYFIWQNSVTSWAPGGVAIFIINHGLAGLLYPLSSIGAFAMVARSAYFRVHDPTNDDHNISPQLEAPSSSLSNLRIARRYSDGRMSGDERLGRTLARFHGIYFGFYTGAGILLIILGVIIQSQAQSLNLGQYTILAFWSLGMISLVGAFCYLGIPPCPRSDVIPGTPTPYVSPWKTAILPFTNSRFRPYAILLVLCGMVEAYGYIDFVLYISTPRIGPKSSGLVTGFALFVDGVISFLLGLAVYKGYFTIKAVLVFGIISLILALSYSIVLSAAAVTDNVGPDGWVYLGTLNFIKSVDEDGIDDWAQVNNVEIYHYLIVALSIILTGMGLMPFKAHLPSAVHQIYQPTPYHLQISAHIKGLRAVGFVLQSIIDIIIGKITGQYSQVENIIAAIILLVLSIISFLPLSTVWLIDYKKQRH